MITHKLVKAEFYHRLQIWSSLKNMSRTTKLDPGYIRKLGIYGGAQGIWVDKSRTQELTEDGHGISVSVLYTGSSSGDDLGDDCILYPYPNTNRPASRDNGEIEATKNAFRHHIPIFVVTYPSPNSNNRNVQLAWVTDWDDESHFFLIEFGEKQPRKHSENIDESPFMLINNKARSLRSSQTYEGEQKFKFEVLKRYGPYCAFCDFSVFDLLDAVHLCTRKDHGSDDPRNGLVLCSLHHRAFEALFAGINPDTLGIITRPHGPDKQTLKIIYENISHLRKLPHTEALRWCWSQWCATYNT